MATEVQVVCGLSVSKLQEATHPIVPCVPLLVSASTKLSPTEYPWSQSSALSSALVIRLSIWKIEDSDLWYSFRVATMVLIYTQIYRCTRSKKCDAGFNIRPNAPRQAELVPIHAIHVRRPQYHAMLIHVVGCCWVQSAWNLPE